MDKPTLLQMYLTNEASRNLYNQKYLYGNLRTNPMGAKINRTSSHLSSNSNMSNNPTQTTYLSPVNTTHSHANQANFLYVNNCSNCQKLNANGSCQIPSMPPPPLPPYTNINQFCGVNVPPSTASLLRNKDSFMSNKSSNRFSTFKNNNNVDVGNNCRLPPVPLKNSKSFQAHNNQDENQYLQPECNTYSMVDSEYQSESQYYCDDGICRQEENSNMYSEVVEDYMEEPTSFNCDVERKPALNIKNKLNASYLNNLKLKQSKFNKSKRFSVQKNLVGFNFFDMFNLICICFIKAKLKDLIAMPEEYDKEESIEHSHISDQELFNLTSSVLRREKSRMEEQTDLLVELEEPNDEILETLSDSSHLHSSDSSVNSTLRPAASVLNGLFRPTSLYSKPENNDTAKKILGNC